MKVQREGGKGKGVAGQREGAGLETAIFDSSTLATGVRMGSCGPASAQVFPGLDPHLHHLRLEEDDGVWIPYGRQQQALGLPGAAGNHNLQMSGATAATPLRWLVTGFAGNHNLQMSGATAATPLR